MKININNLDQYDFDEFEPLVKIKNKNKQKGSINTKDSSEENTENKSKGDKYKQNKPNKQGK